MLALAVVLAAREITMLERMWVKAAGIVMPALIGWVVLAILQALVETMSIRADVSVADNLDARRTRTKLTMFNRLAAFVIVFVTVVLMLLNTKRARYRPKACGLGRARRPSARRRGSTRFALANCRRADGRDRTD